jgi:hypothetical protein
MLIKWFGKVPRENDFKSIPLFSINAKAAWANSALSFSKTLQDSINFFFYFDKIGNGFIVKMSDFMMIFIKN